VEVEITRLKNLISSQSNIVFLVACLTQHLESHKLSDNLFVFVLAFSLVITFALSLQIEIAEKADERYR
jgi:hypothetical protein